MADRIGIISGGEIKLVRDKAGLMRELGRKRFVIELGEPVEALPADLEGYGLEMSAGGCELVYTYDTQGDGTGIRRLLNDLSSAGITARDVRTEQSSLEDIFVDLVDGEARA